MSPRRTIHVVDSTLRDGEQTPGIAFPRAAKVRLVLELARIGVPEIEAGIPAMGPSACADIRAILDLGLHSRITGWCRADLRDIDAAAATGLRAVHIAFPVSDRQLEAFDKDLCWLRESIDTVLPVARDLFDFVSVGAMDASRVSLERLLSFAGAVEPHRPDRLRLADTVGIWTPMKVHHAFSSLGHAYPSLSLGFHGHNDLGMASANAYTAVEAGADSVDVTVNGLGDRAGNVSLAAFVMAMETSRRWSTSVQPEGLHGISDYVAELCGEALPADMPVVGHRVFDHEAGIHVRGLLRDRLSFQPYLPEHVGRAPERFIAGPHSGSSFRTLTQHHDPCSSVPAAPQLCEGGSIRG
jgi:homocitrate synthase NifV